MNNVTPFVPPQRNPILEAIAKHEPITAVVLRQAILYEEVFVDFHNGNIEALTRALARHTGAQGPAPALQESARRTGG